MSGTTHDAATGKSKRWKHGKAVLNGEVRFTSVSALEMADSSSGSGCLRRWFYRYVMGIKEDETDNKSLIRGNAGHAEIAKYLTTGSKAHLSGLVLKGLHQLPPPGPDLAVEYDFVPDLPDGRSGLSEAKLRAAGIPVLGAIDLMHARPENYGVSDVETTRDQPGVLKLVDHKFPGNMKNAKTGPQLVETLQMSGYAKWAFETFTGLKRVRLTHNYFPAQGSPRAPTALVTRDQVEDSWKRAHVVAGCIRDSARETEASKVEANTRACRAYGRDCPAASVCPDFGGGEAEYGLSDFVGQTAADRFFNNGVRADNRNHLPVLNPNQPGDPAPMTTQPTQPTNNIFAFVQQHQAPPAAPTPPPALPNFMMPGAPAATAPAPTLAPAPVPQGPSPEVQAEIARLAAAEAAAMAPAPMPTPAPAPAPALTPTPAPEHPTIALIRQIIGYGLGFPTLRGFAAGNVGKLAGIAPVPRGNDHFIDGDKIATGELNKFEIDDVAKLPLVLEEVKSIASRRAAEQAGASVFAAPPAPAPAPTPAPAAPPPAPTPTTQVGIGALPPDAPPSNPALASKGPDAPAAEKPKKAKKPKADAAAPATVVNVVNVTPAPASTPMPVDAATDGAPVAPTTPAPSSPDGTADAASCGTINLYVDCGVIEGIQTQSFWPIVDFLTAEMTRQSGAEDFRFAGKDSKFSYGGWRGWVRAALFGMVERNQIPKGNYALSGASDEIAGAVVAAMAEIIRKTGGVYVRGGAR